jgi:hypothetical protein
MKALSILSLSIIVIVASGGPALGQETEIKTDINLQQTGRIIGGGPLHTYVRVIVSGAAPKKYWLSSDLNQQLTNAGDALAAIVLPQEDQAKQKEGKYKGQYLIGLVYGSETAVHDIGINESDFDKLMDFARDSRVASTQATSEEINATYWNSDKAKATELIKMLRKSISEDTEKQDLYELIAGYYLSEIPSHDADVADLVGTYRTHVAAALQDNIFEAVKRAAGIKGVPVYRWAPLAGPKTIGEIENNFWAAGDIAQVNDPENLGRDYLLNWQGADLAIFGIGNSEGKVLTVPEFFVKLKALPSNEVIKTLPYVK